MAKRITLIDDLTNEETDSVNTIPFMVNGEYYEIELSDGSMAKLNAALEPFVKVARSITTLRARTIGAIDEAPKIREWAKTTGEEINERGRIPQEIVDKYRAAMAGDKPEISNNDTGDNAPDAPDAPDSVGKGKAAK